MKKRIKMVISLAIVASMCFSYNIPVLAGSIDKSNNLIKGSTQDVSNIKTVKEDYKNFLEIASVSGVGKTTTTNVLTPEYGSFVALNNVKNKKLTANTYSRLKNEISKIGVPGNVVDFILENVAGVEGDNIGDSIVDLLPGSIIYGNKLANVINNAVNNEDFVDVNLYKEEIKPKDNLKGFSAIYEIPVMGKENIQGDLTLSIKGIKYGKRDNFTVDVSTISIDGTERKFPVARKQINEREANFEVEINGVNNNIDKIRVYYNNKFNKPKDPSRYIADLIKNSINGSARKIVKFKKVTPISNKAANDIAKALKDIGFNEMAGNGDIGKIVADKVVANIPIAGWVLKLIGGTDWVADQVRKIVNQAEVISYAKLSGAQILVKNNVSVQSISNLAIDYGENSRLETVKYDFNDNNPKIKYLGNKWSNQNSLIWNTHSSNESQTLAIIDENDYSDFEAETKITLLGDGNAGLEFRINNVVGEKNQYQGYMAGIGAYKNGKTEIFLLKHDFDHSRCIKQLFDVPIVRNKEYTLKVVANGANIKMYLDGKLYIDEFDNSYSDGYIGYSLWNNNVKFDDLIISERTADNKTEYNFSSSKPEFEPHDSAWVYAENKSSSVLRCIARNRMILGQIKDKYYSDFIAETKVDMQAIGGNAGIEFRVNNFEKADNNQFQGYLAAVGVDNNGEQEVFLGKHDFGWRGLKKVNFKKDFINLASKPKLSVMAKGSNIKVFLNDKLMIDVNDSSFSEGGIGYTTFNSMVDFDNLEIISLENLDLDRVNTPKDIIVNEVEYDFSNNKPKMNFNKEEHKWTYASGKLTCFSQNTQALSIIENSKYSNFIAETKLILAAAGGNAGIEFRVNNVKGMGNQFQGYLAAINIINNGKAEVFLGKHDFGWKGIKAVKKTIDMGKEQKLKVKAYGNNIKVYLNDELMIDVYDASFTDGSIGYSLFNCSVTYDDFKISSLK